MKRNSAQLGQQIFTLVIFCFRGLIGEGIIVALYRRFLVYTGGTGIEEGASVEEGAVVEEGARVEEGAG